MIKTLKALHKYIHERPDQEVICISLELSNYISLLSEEYTDSIIRGIPMSKKHKDDYWLFNDCIMFNGVKFVVGEEK